MFSRALLAVAPMLVLSVQAQFNLYPPISADALASALNISSGCLSAMNATVDCDQTLFSMAGNVDGFFWSDDNATALCTNECLSSAASWWAAASSACDADQLNSYGRLYPADTVPGRFVDGLNIVCVTANTDLNNAIGINATVATPTLVDQYNSTVTAYDASGSPVAPSAEATIQPVPFPDGIYSRQDSTTSQYCLVDSYNWVGSDIIRPDCTEPANANASQCIDPTDVPPENARIANLYPNDLLCSQCFLNMYYLRIASPFLPDTDASDDLVAQWYDILDVCNATASAPSLLVRSLPFYDNAPGISGNFADNSSITYPGPQPLTGNSTCPYGTITLDNINVQVNLTTETACDAIGKAYNTSAGNFALALGSFDCMPVGVNSTETPDICAPEECSGTMMPGNTTCDDFAAGLPGNVTTTQFLSWNLNLVGLCSSTTQQWVCIGAPGGTYISPPASNATTSAGSQQRGGGDGSGSATGSGGVGGASRNSTYVKPGQPAPSPTQSGISPECTQYGQAQSGDGCYSFSQDYDITQQALESWNSVLGPNGENCTTKFFAGYFYCIGINSPSSTTSAPPSSTTASNTTPSPVQSGIDPQCTTYAKAASGDNCNGFAADNNITPTQLYSWNPVLGSNGANCDNDFWAGEYYCVGAPDGGSTPTSSAATTTTSVAVPSPTQSGIASNCNAYAEAVSGDYCYQFAQEHSITTANLYAWNTVLGSTGQNCNNEFFAGYYYCIGVSGSSK